MNPTCRKLGVVLLAVLASRVSAGDQAESSDDVQPDSCEWPISIENLVFQPAEVKVVRQPDADRPLATLKLEDEVAPTDFVPTRPEYAAFVKSDVPNCTIVHGGLTSHAEYYTDRTYKLAEVPEELTGLTLLQMKNGHKAIVDARFAIVVQSAKPFYCFVALDQRSIQTYGKDGMPSWLEEFSLTEYRIGTTERNMARSGNKYFVLVRYVPEGRAALGPNAGHPSTNSMYFAFFGVADD